MKQQGKLVVHINEVSNVAAALCKGLEEIGFVTEINPLTSGKGLTRLKLLRIRLKEFARLRKRMRRADIVHIHYGFFGILGILARVPYYLHLHGSDVRVNLKTPILGFLTRVAILRAKKVFYSTPDLAETIKTHRKDAIFIPNPILSNRFVPPARGSSQLAPSILSISRLNRNKGIDIVFRSLAKIKSKYPDVFIASMGSGLHSGEFGGMPFVDHYVEETAYAEMPKVFAQYDILIGQMALGAIGMSELEGMSSSRPLLANFKWGHVYPEPPPIIVVQHHLELSQRLAELIHDWEKLSSLGKLSREWVMKYHDYRAVARTLAYHYGVNEDGYVAKD